MVPCRPWCALGVACSCVACDCSECTGIGWRRGGEKLPWPKLALQMYCRTVQTNVSAAKWRRGGCAHDSKKFSEQEKARTAMVRELLHRTPGGSAADDSEQPDDDPGNKSRSKEQGAWECDYVVM